MAFISFIIYICVILPECSGRVLMVTPESSLYVLREAYAKKNWHSTESKLAAPRLDEVSDLDF